MMMPWLTQIEVCDQSEIANVDALTVERRRACDTWLVAGENVSNVDGGPEARRLVAQWTATDSWFDMTCQLQIRLVGARDVCARHIWPFTTPT